MIHSNVPLPYGIEYAKSSRSNCKKCKKLIGLNSLRMSLHRPSTFFDGNMDSWFHYECFWKNLTRGRDEINISSIRGVDWLRWEDQEDLRQRVQDFKKTTSAPPVAPDVPTVYLSVLHAEKSASNRGKCAKCSTNLEKCEIKVIHKSKGYHVKCHLEGFEKIEGTFSDVPDWMFHEECWRNRVLESCEEIMKAKGTTAVPQPEVSTNGEETEGNTHESKPESVSIASKNDPHPAGTCSEVVVDANMKSESDSPSSVNNKRPASLNEERPTESDAAKKRRLAKEEKMAELKKKRLKTQADQLWESRLLFEKLTHAERMAVLKLNDQAIPDGHNSTAQVFERLSDNAIFGTPIACLKCDGKIEYNSARRTYVCTGYATEYTKCTFESKNPTRTSFLPTPRLLEKCKNTTVSFNSLHERLYVQEEETEKVITVEKRKSKGGVHGDHFMYAAEAFDSNNRIPIKLDDLTSTNTHILKNGTVVDAKFQYANRSHVYKNEVDGSLYQATLSFTDVSQNKNSFYKLQLLKDDFKETYYVFRSWGRVGTEVGDTMYETYGKELAIERFEELFNEKTKNDWKYRKHFRKMHGAFNYVETDYSDLVQLGEQDVAPGTKTLLPKGVKEIVMSIFDIENMKSALKSFEMDINKMPLGRLSNNQINQAFHVLNDLSEILSVQPLDHDRILDCTNKFYTIIPHNFGMKVPEPIDNIHKVKEKNNMLNALLEIKFAYDQICGDDKSSAVNLGMDPVDVNYKKLKCALTPMERGCDDWQMIQEYIKNTKGSTHDIKVDLMDILMVDRESESSKFKAHIGNRRLLWHGSGRMNFAGILGQGLRIAPPEAPMSGYMFGKGVYFADMFSKSFFYCRANAREEAYLLLCDVALGEMSVQWNAVTVTKSTLPKGTSSVKGIGRECPQESGDYHHPDGYLVPKGPKHTQLTGDRGINFSLLYNEYIVYDVDQIQLKYLVRVKVHHASHSY